MKSKIVNGVLIEYFPNHNGSAKEFIADVRAERKEHKEKWKSSYRSRFLSARSKKWADYKRYVKFDHEMFLVFPPKDANTTGENWETFGEKWDIGEPALNSTTLRNEADEVVKMIIDDFSFNSPYHFNSFMAKIAIEGGPYELAYETEASEYLKAEYNDGEIDEDPEHTELWVDKTVARFTVVGEELKNKLKEGIATYKILAEKRRKEEEEKARIEEANEAVNEKDAELEKVRRELLDLELELYEKKELLEKKANELNEAKINLAKL